MKNYNFGVFGIYEAFDLVMLEKEIIEKEEVQNLLKQRKSNIANGNDGFSEMFDIVYKHSKEMFIPIPEQMKEYFDLDDSGWLVYNPRY